MATKRCIVCNNIAINPKTTNKLCHSCYFESVRPSEVVSEYYNSEKYKKIKKEYEELRKKKVKEIYGD